MKFKKGDHVRVIPGTKLEETEELVPNWVGEIIDVPDEGNDIYEIKLDTISLQNLPPKFNESCIEQEDPPYTYCFEGKELELTTRRDTQEQRVVQQEEMEATYLEEEDEVLDIATIHLWHIDFEQSSFFGLMDKNLQEEAKSTIEAFAKYAYNYTMEQPDGWTSSTVQEVCEDLFPRKFTAEKSFFEETGIILTQFFAFLNENKLQENAAELFREIKKAAPKMVQNSQNPHRWGMAKSMMMGALNKGVDLSDQNAINQYMGNYQIEMVSKAMPKSRAQSIQQNPLKNLSRNQTIQVKYSDGTTKEGKFKRLEADLLAGKCEYVRIV